MTAYCSVKFGSPFHEAGEAAGLVYPHEKLLNKGCEIRATHRLYWGGNHHITNLCPYHRMVAEYIKYKPIKADSWWGQRMEIDKIVPLDSDDEPC